MTAGAPGGAAGLEAEVLDRCRAALPGWRELTVDDVDFDPPKGFSTFTMGVRPRHPVDPPAVLFRRLAGKENAILDADAERRVFLLLGERGIAAHCHAYDDEFRIEEFYRGRTLRADDVFDDHIQVGVARELAQLHRTDPTGLPERSFFELLHERWTALARHVLGDGRVSLPADEQALCDELAEIHSEETHRKVMRCLPSGPTVFCHNDTYHGNVFLRDDGSIRLLDFEFSCRNHVAFDIANLFAETVMEHGFTDPPHFRIAEPRFTDSDLARFVGHYLDHGGQRGGVDRDEAQVRLTRETSRAVMLSDYMYAMAALPLALEPIQTIRFVPYAHQRFHRFLRTWDEHRWDDEPAHGDRDR